MTMPLSPQDIQALTAGYVLGDLTSEEAELFRALLVERPELRTEIIALQETLALMPCGLGDEAINPEVKSQLLAKAHAELSQASLAPLAPTAVPQSARRQPSARMRRYPPKLPWLMSATAASLAIVCGFAALRLGNQLRFLRAQVESSPEPVNVLQSWSGLDQILQDHQKSLANPEGPVDFVVGRPSDVLDLLHGFQTTTAALPLLPAYQGQLLGGSNCRFGKSQGLRLTYQLSTEQTVSAYQLEVSDEALPVMESAQMALQHPDGTGMVLWRDENYLYAVVADLPLAELQGLAHAINGT